MNTTRLWLRPGFVRPVCGLLVLLQSMSAQLSDWSAQNGATNGLAPFIENVVRVAGPTTSGSGILLDCKPESQLTLSCVLATVEHVLASIKGQFATVDLRNGRFQSVQIRETFLNVGLSSPDREPISPNGSIDVSVGGRVYTIELPPGKNTLSGLRDALIAAASRTGVFASVVNRGTEKEPRYTIRIFPHESINHPQIEIALYNHGSQKNLLVDQALWGTSLKGHYDLSLIRVEVPKTFERYRLTRDQFADSATLKQVEAGDSVRCIGYAFGKPSTNLGFPAIQSGAINSYPFPPNPDMPTFSIDFTVFPGQSGGPCVVFPTGQKITRPLIVGIIVSQALYTEETATGSHSLTVAGVVLKSSLIREAIEVFEDSETKK